MSQHRSRKLAVILHADIADSTRLVQADESLAHSRIRDVLRRLAQTVKRYGGIAHELRGDALVAEFARVSDAVAAALAGQAGNALLNDSLDDHARVQLRVGIGMGEVVIADHTVTGAGVVLARRLEELAEPGGVCIQGAAYETIPRRLPFDYESLGERQLKGFDEPVRAYSVATTNGESIPLPERPFPRWRKHLIAAALATSLVAFASSQNLFSVPTIEAYQGCVLVVDRFIVCKVGEGSLAKTDP